MSDSQNLYSTLHDLSQCTQLDKTFFICDTHEPFYSLSSRPICETELLNLPRSIPNNCDLRTITRQLELWHRLEKPNHWIYILPHSTRVSFKCNDSISATAILQHTGIIQLNPDCLLYSSHTTILPNKKTSINTFYQSFLPQFPLDTFQIEQSSFSNLHIKISNITPIKLHVDSLRSATVKLDNIRSNADELLKQVTVTPEHIVITHYFVTCFVFVMIIAFITYFIRRFHQKCFSFKKHNHSHKTVNHSQINLELESLKIPKPTLSQPQLKC